MHQESIKIPFKRANLSLIEKRIAKVVERTRLHYETAPIGEEFESFVQTVYSCFPLQIRYDIFFSSMMPYVNTQLTVSTIKSIMWWLAGNVDKLKAGTVISPWSRQVELEWVPITLLRATPARGYNGKFGYSYEYRVLAGSPAGLKFKVFWSLKYLKFLSRKLGFKRIKRTRAILKDGRDLVRMQLYVLLDPALSRNDQPGFYHFYVPPSMLKKNQQIIKQRIRIIKCPLGYSLEEKQCHNCYLGYMDSPDGQCVAACHPMTYIDKPCPRCEKVSWFDPISKSAICVNCEDTQVRVG